MERTCGRLARCYVPLLVVPVVLSIAFGCSAREGSCVLVVIVDSEFPAPSDVDHLRVDVVRKGRSLLHAAHDFGDVEGPTLARFRLTAPDSIEPARISVVAFRHGAPRIERSIVVPIPTGRTTEVRLVLSLLCDWTAPEGDGGTYVSSCPDQLTCMDGACRSPNAEETATDADLEDAVGVSTLDARPPSAPLCSEAEDDVRPRDRSVRCRSWPYRPIGEACTGPSSIACGRCGVRPRVCINGHWRDWSTCAQQGPCAPEEVAACDGGTMRCGQDCQWQECQFPQGGCTGPLSQSCDRCGTQLRTCDDGGWSEWGSCEGPAGCVDAAVSDGREPVQTDGGCLPGSRRCDGIRPQVCSWAGEWQAEAPCQYACTGAGVCETSNVVCWQLSDLAPFASPPGIFTAVAAGRGKACGLRADGLVLCWVASGGESEPFPDTYTALSACHDSFCGLRTDGFASCWGDNKVTVESPPAETFVSISTSYGQSCGLRADGYVRCWGLMSVRTTPGPYTAIAAGTMHACGLRQDGSIECWGFASDQRKIPPSGSFVSLFAGLEHTCALRADGAISCWGDQGALNAPDGPFASVAVGLNASCGRRADGTLLCWDPYQAFQVLTPTGAFSSVSVGEDIACGFPHRP